MITNVLPFLAIACLGLAACTADPMPQAGIESSPQYDGLYKGTAVIVNDLSTACPAFPNAELAVKNGNVMWHTGYTWPYTFHLVKIPVAPNGAFQDAWSGHIMRGQIAGSHMSAISDSGACRYQLALRKVASSSG